MFASDTFGGHMNANCQFTNVKCVRWPELDYKNTHLTLIIYTHFWGPMDVMSQVTYVLEDIYVLNLLISFCYFCTLVLT